MKPTRIKLALLFVLFLGISFACNDKEDDEEKEEKPTTEKRVNDGTTPIVTDKNGIELGELLFNDWPQLGIKLEDGSAAGFHREQGTHFTGLCQNNYCDADEIDHEHITIQATGENTGFLFGTGAFDRSYCYYNENNCAGTCNLAAKPIENAVFQIPDGSFLKATGDEAAVDDLAIASFYSQDLAECFSSASNIGIIKKAYPITEEYEFPSAVEYPFEGPLEIIY